MLGADEVDDPLSLREKTDLEAADVVDLSVDTRLLVLAEECAVEDRSGGEGFR